MLRMSHHLSLRSLVVLGGLALLIAPLTAAAAEGDLDGAFDGDGKLTVDMSSAGEIARAIAIQDDGKIVVVGTGTNTTQDIVVLRLHPDGSRDLSFSGDGRATFDFVWGTDEGWDVAIQPDGKIVVVGTATIDAMRLGAVLRLNPNGSYDTSFNSTGYNLVNFGNDAWFYGVDLQSDGKIVVAGKTAVGTAIAVARLTSGGVLDTAFSGDGKLTWDSAWGTDEAWDVKVLTSGKIVVGGFARIDTITNFAVLRYNSNGSLDGTFNTSGYSLFHFGGNSYGRALAIQNDGRIIIAGSSDPGSTISVARLTTGGSLDGTFSGDGMATYNGFWGNDEGRDVVLQEDGKILVGGFIAVDSLDNFAISRWTTSGVLDTTFGPTGNGIAAVNFARDGFAYGLALHPANGRIMVVGTTAVGAVPIDTFAVTCHLGPSNHSGLFADTFEIGTLNMWSATGP